MSDQQKNNSLLCETLPSSLVKKEMGESDNGSSICGSEIEDVSTLIKKSKSNLLQALLSAYKEKESGNSTCDSNSEEAGHFVKESQSTLLQATLSAYKEIQDGNSTCDSNSEGVGHFIKESPSSLLQTTTSTAYEEKEIHCGNSTCDSNSEDVGHLMKESQSKILQTMAISAYIKKEIHGGHSSCDSNAEESFKKSEPPQNMKEEACSSKGENGGNSKVVVQVLPSVNLGGISALAELTTLSGLSTRSVDGKNSLKSGTNSLCSSAEESAVDVEGTSDVDVLYNNKLISEIKQNIIQNRSRQVSKRSLKKRKSFNGFTGTYSIHPGNGMKLTDIKHIATELASVSPQVIRILHYLLFEVYGLISNESQIERTRQNILQFSGFSFTKDSVMFMKKQKALLNLPYPLLVCIYKALLDSYPETRTEAVATLLQFFLKPTDVAFNEKMKPKKRNE